MAASASSSVRARLMNPKPPPSASMRARAAKCSIFREHFFRRDACVRCGRDHAAHTTSNELAAAADVQLGGNNARVRSVSVAAATTTNAWYRLRAGTVSQLQRAVALQKAQTRVAGAKGGTIESTAEHTWPQGMKVAPRSATVSEPARSQLCQALATVRGCHRLDLEQKGIVVAQMKRFTVEPGTQIVASGTMTNGHVFLVTQGTFEVTDTGLAVHKRLMGSSKSSARLRAARKRRASNAVGSAAAKPHATAATSSRNIVPTSREVTAGQHFVDVDVLSPLSISSVRVMCTAKAGGEVWVVDRAAVRSAILEASSATNDSRVMLLSSVRALAVLSYDQRMRLAEALEKKTFPKGTALCRQGDAKGDTLFILESGAVNFMAAERGKVSIVASFSKQGDYFGVESLWSRAPYPATAIAATDVSALTLTSRAFRACVGSMRAVLLHQMTEMGVGSGKRHVEGRAGARPRRAVTAAHADTALGVPEDTGTRRRSQHVQANDASSAKAAAAAPPPKPKTTKMKVVEEDIPLLVADDPLYGFDEDLGPPPSTPAAGGRRRGSSIAVADDFMKTLNSLREDLKDLGDVGGEELKSLEDVASSAGRGAGGKAANDTLIDLPKDGVAKATNAVEEEEQERLSEVTAAIRLENARRRLAKLLKVKDLKTIGVLGSGSFGEVKLVQDRTGRYHALKSISKSVVVFTRQLPQIMNEKQVLSTLAHSQVVQLRAVFQDANDVHFLLEPCMGGELTRYMLADILPLETLRFIAASLVLILEYLHDHDVVYRDLKPDNLMVTEKGYMKLTDFGFAKVVAPGSKTQTLCGTPDYTAPEVIAGGGHGAAVDWWSLGALMYELATGDPPFWDENPMMIYQHITDLKMTAPYPEDMDPLLRDLVEKLLVKEIVRLGDAKTTENPVDYVRNHEFFKGYDWYALERGVLKSPFKVDLDGPEDLKNFAPLPGDEESDDEDHDPEVIMVGGMAIPKKFEVEDGDMDPFGDF